MTEQPDTPRTDAAMQATDLREMFAGLIGFVDFSRTLERELAAALKECEEQARLNGMGAEREAALLAERHHYKFAADQCAGFSKVVIAERDALLARELAARKLLRDAVPNKLHCIEYMWTIERDAFLGSSK